MNALSTKQAVALALVMALASLTGCPSNTPFQFSEDVTFTEAVPYGVGWVEGGTVQTVLYGDMVEPATPPEGALPALVMVHGGGFEDGSRADANLRVVADNLASIGYFCFLIDYRLADDDPPLNYPFPKLDISYPAARAAIVDTKTAVRYVRANAAVFGVDPARIGLMGESAGAVAVLAAGLSDAGEYLDDGSDLEVPEQNHPGVDSTVSAIVDCWGSADYFLDSFDAADPPILIWHGTNDTTEGTWFTAALAVVLECQTLGIPYEFFPLLGEGHGAWDASYAGIDLSNAIAGFLGRYL